jgi:hypothetical protein
MLSAATRYFKANDAFHASGGRRSRIISTVDLSRSLLPSLTVP